MPNQRKPNKTYLNPQILHKGQLKQFAGSPLGSSLPGPFIPGVPKE